MELQGVLKPPLSVEKIRKLKVGELVSITGQVVTARDKAYGRTLKLLRAGKKIPIDLRGSIVYHCGPLVRRAKKGFEILSAGPTTSARLDRMQTEFISGTGVRAMIGKGGVSEEIARELPRLGCIYLAFTGGAGALAARSIVGIEKIMWRDLGLAEAVWVLKVEGFGPLVVAVDLHGGNLYSRAKS